MGTSSDWGRRKVGGGAGSGRRRDLLWIGGFTLQELIAVMTIILILGGSAWCGLEGVPSRAERTALERDAKIVEIVCREYRARFGVYPSEMAELERSGLLERESLLWRRGPDWALLLVPSSPLARDVAAAWVVPREAWHRARPMGGWGWGQVRPSGSWGR
jgi:type II secretory pathway pseudopilin PulG